MSRKLAVLASLAALLAAAACADATGPKHDCTGGVTQGGGSCVPI